MTIFATSISIVLTFGTGQWMENRKKQEDGRQMAMMVISDIDENVAAFKELAESEEKQFEMAMYVEQHLNQIHQVPDDTLLEVWSYLAEGDLFMPDDSKERIFNSSPETWKNIDNALFINIVQAFYQQRRLYDDHLDHDIAWRAPISQEEQYRQVTSCDAWNYDAIAAVLTELMPTRKVQLFLEYSTSRSRLLYARASDWQQMSDQCKFIMGITDDELQEYLNKQQRTGSSLTDKQLVGTWVATSSLGKNEETITFTRDHRFMHYVLSYKSSPLFVGKGILRRTMEGTWRIQGDSLFRDYESEFLEFDRNNIEYPADMKDSVEHVIARFEKTVVQHNEKVKQEGPSMGHRVNAAFIDHSGSKIELTKTDLDEEGEEETYTSYMVRQAE